MRETEITVQVFNSFKQVDEILKSQGFFVVENYQMTDWYFSKNDNVLKFDYLELMRQSFLVRKIEDEIYLCYKNKELDADGNVIAEEKIKTTACDLKKVLKIFKMAKLNNYCVVDNNSFVYKKDDIVFVVQIIKDLGIFIEYEEDETMANMKTSKEKFAYMSNTVKSLGLELGNDFSCKKMFMLLHKEKI